MTPTRYAATVSPPRPWTHLSGEKGFTHDYTDDRGNRGIVNVIPRDDNPEGQTLHVDWVGPRGVSPGEVSHTSGFENIRSMGSQLFQHYPNAVFVSGLRTGGAHAEAPKRATIRIPGRKKVKPPIERIGSASGVVFPKRTLMARKPQFQINPSEFPGEKLPAYFQSIYQSNNRVRKNDNHATLSEALEGISNTSPSYMPNILAVYPDRSKLAVFEPWSQVVNPTGRFVSAVSSRGDHANPMGGQAAEAQWSSLHYRVMRRLLDAADQFGYAFGTRKLLPGWLRNEEMLNQVHPIIKGALDALDPNGMLAAADKADDLGVDPFAGENVRRYMTELGRHLEEVRRQRQQMSRRGSPVRFAASDQQSRARKVDLITMPSDVEGTSCGNCLHANQGVTHCDHPEVDLPITSRMCCNLWDHKGTTRPEQGPERKRRLPLKVLKFSSDQMALIRGAAMARSKGDDTGVLAHADYLQDLGYNALPEFVRRSVSLDNPLDKAWDEKDAMDWTRPAVLTLRFPRGGAPLETELHTKKGRDGRVWVQLEPLSAWEYPDYKTVSNRLVTTDRDLLHRLISEAEPAPANSYAEDLRKRWAEYLNDIGEQRHENINQTGRQFCRPRRYAKVDGDVPAHPLVAGFPLEFFLRHLANDPSNSSNVRNLSKVAITGGEKGHEGPGAPEALWMLADALEEEGHPKASFYNLRSAADKVRLDQHTYTALREAAEDTKRATPHAATYEDYAFSPEAHALRAASALDYTGAQHNILYRRDRDLLQRVRDRVSQLMPDVDKKHIDESIRRHQARAHHLWIEKNGMENDKEVSRQRSINPLFSSKATENTTLAKEQKASRYRRPVGKIDIAAAKKAAHWLSKNGLMPGYGQVFVHPRGEAWYVGGDGDEDGFGELVEKNLKAVPGIKKVTYEAESFPSKHEGGWHQVYPKDRPHKFALNARGDFIDTLRRVRSKQQQSLRRAAQQIAQKLGLHPTTTIDALHDSPEGATPGVAQAIYGGASPEAIQGAAAYLAMINNQSGFGVFHVRPGGPDRLHRFRQQGSGLELRHQLDRAGVTNRVLVPHRKGYDVIVPDPGGRLTPTLREFTRIRGTDLQTSPGFFKVVGDQDQARAREMFRGQVSQLSRVKRYAMEDERAAFERAIDAQPEDANNHLVYADWLEDHDPNEAAFRRAMGEWVQKRPRIRSTGESGFSLGRTHPWWTWVGDYPSGVDQIPRHYQFSGRGSHPTDHEPDIGVVYGRGVHWLTYRGMEDGFRRAFMANRGQTRMSRPRRYAWAKPESGQLTREQHGIADLAAKHNSEDAWGVLADHLQESGFPNVGATITHGAARQHGGGWSELNFSHPGDRAIADTNYKPGSFRYAVFRDGPNLLHSVRLNVGGRHFHFWRREMPNQRRLARPGAYAVSEEVMNRNQQTIAAKKRAQLRAAQDRYRDKVRGTEPADLAHRIVEHIRTAGPQHRRGLMAKFPVDAASLDAATQHAINAGQLEVEHKPGLPTGGGPPTRWYKAKVV